MDPSRLPKRLRNLTGNFSWKEVTAGKSGDRVFRLQSGSKTRYLKVSERAASPEIQSEHSVLEWLASLSVPFSPRSLYFHSSPRQNILLMTSIAGTGLDTNNITADIAAKCAKVLYFIHSLPAEACPFDQRLDSKIREARYRVQRGAVAESDFDYGRMGQNAQSVLTEVLASSRIEEDVVFTHGDFTPGNILFNETEFSGVVDWGSGGLADRYQDLALFCRGLVDPELIKHFLLTYGIGNPDRRKLQFYTILDELF